MMISALKKNKFTQTLATGTAAIGVLASSMLITPSANAAQVTWSQWSTGTPLIQGDKKITYIANSPDFTPDNLDNSQVELLSFNDQYLFTWYAPTVYGGSGSFTYKIEVTAPNKVITGISLDSSTLGQNMMVQKFVCAGNALACDSTNDLLTLTSTNGSPDPASGFTSVTPATSFVITDSLTGAGGGLSSLNNGFTQAVPEPLTILGTGVVLGALPTLKKEYAKRKKKKDGNA